MALLVWIGCAPKMKAPVSKPVAAAVRESLERADSLLKPWPWLSDSAVRADLSALYGKRRPPAYWISDSGLTTAASSLAFAIARARLHGLDPAVYGVAATINEARTVLARYPHATCPPESLADIEVRLSAGYVACARHLWWGRVPTTALDPDWMWGRDSVDLVARLSEAARNGRVTGVLEMLAPRDTAYLVLQTALARLDIEARGGPALPRSKPPEKDSLGTRRRLELNLERRRWLPRDKPEPRIEVNIPDFRFALVDSGKIQLGMRVVVGQRTHPTPVFSDAMTFVELNPTWRLPKRIIVEEIVPEIGRDTAYLAKQGIRVLWKRSNPFQERHYSTVDWKSAETDTFPYLLRQDPGPLNALGQIKFMLPNEYDVYLHDTPNRAAFQSDRRSRSHGCVRLEKPLELADRLMPLLPTETPDSLAAWLASGTLRQLRLKDRVPVSILYWTAWVDPKGRLQQRDDLYRLDARLDRALREHDLAAFAINPEVVWGAKADSLARAARIVVKKPAAHRPDIAP